MTFKPPDGLEVPEGIKDGEPFEAIATFVPRGGKIMLVKIEGKALPGYEKQAQAADRGEPVADSDQEHSEQDPSGDDFEENVRNAYGNA